MFVSVTGKPSFFAWRFSIQNRFALHNLDDTKHDKHHDLSISLFLHDPEVRVSLIWDFHRTFFSFTFFIFDTKTQGALTFSHYSICITWLTILTSLCQRFNFLICIKSYFFLMPTRCNGDGCLSADSFLTSRWFCWFPKNYFRILHFFGDGGWVISIFNWWRAF